MIENVNYSEIIEKIEVVNKWLLLKLADKVETKKDIYLRNSIAKGISLLKSIDLLYRQKAYNEGWILYRSLVDRLVYIYYLTENDNFNTFEEWSYIKTYEYRNNARADEKFKNVLKNPVFDVKNDESNKYRDLKRKKTEWNKPIPKTILKNKGIDFLYKFGYDYASMHTHPMANDGEFEFYSLTGLEPNPYKNFYQEILITDSILVNTLIQQEILNYLDFKFRGLVYSFLEETRKKINNETNEFDFKLYQLLKCVEAGISWFEK